jgi:hypothetical protein
MASKLRQPCCPNIDLAKFLSITQARGSPRPHARNERLGGPRRAPDSKQTRRDLAQGATKDCRISNRNFIADKPARERKAPEVGPDRSYGDEVVHRFGRCRRSRVQRSLGRGAARDLGSGRQPVLRQGIRHRRPLRGDARGSAAAAFRPRPEPVAAGRGLHRAARERLPAARRPAAARLRLHDLGDRPGRRRRPAGDRRPRRAHRPLYPGLSARRQLRGGDERDLRPGRPDAAADPGEGATAAAPDSACRKPRAGTEAEPACGQGAGSCRSGPGRRAADCRAYPGGSTCASRAGRGSARARRDPGGGAAGRSAGRGPNRRSGRGTPRGAAAPVSAGPGAKKRPGFPGRFRVQPISADAGGIA